MICDILLIGLFCKVCLLYNLGIMKVLKILMIGVLSLSLFSFWFAEDDDWTLIPSKWTWDKGVEQMVKEVWSKPWKVWDNYNKQAEKIDVGTAFATGIFSWDTIFEYFKYIAQLLSKIGLVVWAGMIIYAGYKYVIGVFTQDTSKSGKDTVKWAIYGLLIVIFSYAIMRLLMAIFW